MQVASDLTVLKRLQELQNETMIVIEEIIMSNALELVSHNKYAVAVRQDMARLQTQLAGDHEHLQQLHDSLQRHLANTHITNYRAIGESSGRLKMQEWKCGSGNIGTKVKKNAVVENTGVETSARFSTGGKCGSRGYGWLSKV